MEEKTPDQALSNSTEQYDHVYRSLLTEIENRRNCFISAPGGCGKSHMMKQLRDHLNDQGITNAIVSTTGTSAYAIGGRTFHSWAGIMLGEGTAEELVDAMRPNARRRWLNTVVLMVDEISMLGRDLLKKLSQVGQIVRNDDRPFGGIIVVASGDFMQLSPVKDQYCFMDSTTWTELNFKIFTLDTPFRYTDPEWFERLQRIRFAEHTEADVEYIQSRVAAYREGRHIRNGVIPTQLFPTKAQVSHLNQNALDALSTKKYVFKSKDGVVLKNPSGEREVPSDKDMERYLEQLAPKLLDLKVGAQVMVTYNIDVGMGLCNGTRGVVAAIDESLSRVIIRRVDGKLFGIEPQTLSVTYTQNVTLVRQQYPLILAWAITIHKSQGATLDALITDLGSSVFGPSMAYVCLSRARSGGSIFITSFWPKSIFVHEQAREYVKMIEGRQQ